MSCLILESWLFVIFHWFRLGNIVFLGLGTIDQSYYAFGVCVDSKGAFIFLPYLVVTLTITAPSAWIFPERREVVHWAMIWERWQIDWRGKFGFLIKMEGGRLSPASKGGQIDQGQDSWNLVKVCWLGWPWWMEIDEGDRWESGILIDGNRCRVINGNSRRVIDAKYGDMLRQTSSDEFFTW